MYGSDGVKGEHVSKEISGRGRRRSRGVKGNQGVGDFRSINILQFFSIYYYYYYYLFIIFFLTFFTHDIYPHPRHLATLILHWLPVMRTHGHVITKSSRMVRLSHFLRHGATLARARLC